MKLTATLQAAAATLLLVAAPVNAQDPLALDVTLPAPRVLARGALDDGALEDAVRSGLPVRMRFRMELWRDELVDDLMGEFSWSAVVAFEPLDRRFLAAVLPADSLASFPLWDDARRAVEGPFYPDIRPVRAGSYYYIAVLEIETLSLSDLDELERWLRGELEPAVRGSRSLGGAIGTGLKRLFIRILGLPARRYEVRSQPFRIP